MPTMTAVDYTLFQSSLPASFHTEVLEELREGRYEDGAPHETVPRFILRDPRVWREVKALLGRPVVADPCRHVHVSRPQPQDWHVDDYCGEPWPDGGWAILAYFPQDTPAQLGPTAIRVDGVETLAAGPAGTCLLMRNTVEHRATANTTGRERFMVKYLFHRPADL